MGVFDDLIPGGEPSSSTGGAFDDLVPKVKQNKGIAGDLVTDVKRGIQQIPGIATGLLDIPIGAATGEAYAGKAADALGDITGFKPSQWAKDAEAEYSPGRQAASRNVNQAWEDNATPFADAADGDLRGIGQIAKAYIQNPQHTLGSVVESLPSMVAGGVVGRGLAAGSKLVSPVIGAGIGEGAVMAGQQMDQLTEAGVDGRTAAGASALTGIAGGAIGVGGGKIAQALGVVDPETAIAGGATRAIADEVQDKTIKGAIKEGAKRVAGGAMSEGFFEELPQSVLEQALSNLAQGKPWDEGVARAAVEGTLAGAAMGGAFNAMPGKQAEPTSKPPAAEAQEEQKPTLALPAPTYTGTPGDQIIASDVDRQAAIDKAQAESDAIWAARDEYERQQAEYRKQPMPTIINDPEPIQQRIDALMGINESRLQGFARSNYEKALENAFNEQVGWVVGKDDKEIPFTMGDYLKSKVAAADIDRKRQAAQPAPAAAPQPVIPVVGPLSAAANVAVQTGAHANTIMQQTAAMAQQQGGTTALGVGDRFEVGQTWSKGNQRYTIESVSEDGKMGKASFGKGESYTVNLDAEKANGWRHSPSAPNTGAQAPNIAQPAPNTQPQGEGGTPATAQQAGSAAASPAGGEFDVSKRTEQQLTYLALKGKPGWKEAAVTELQKRGVTFDVDQQAKSDTLATAGEAKSDQAKANSESTVALNDANSANEQQAQAADVAPINEGETKQAPEPKAEKPLKSPTEGGPADSIGWTSMTTVQREGLLHRAGYSTKDMKLNIGGKGLLNRAWDSMGKGAREKLIAAHEAQFKPADQNTIKNEAPAAATVSAETGGQNQEPIKKSDHDKAMEGLAEAWANDDAEMESRIKFAADSVLKLRNVDVERVLSQGNVDRQKLADYIKRKRVDLAAEVNDVMAELSAPAADLVSQQKTEAAHVTTKAELFADLRKRLGALSERAINAPGNGALAGRIGGFTVGMKEDSDNLTQQWVDDVVSGYEKQVVAAEKKAAASQQKTDTAQEAAQDKAPTIDDLEKQLRQVEEEMHGQGMIQNARTREKRDQLRKAILEAKHPEILKALDGVPDYAEPVARALEFNTGNEPKAETVRRALKNKGVIDPYLTNMTDAVMKAIGEPAAKTEQAGREAMLESRIADIEAQLRGLIERQEAAKDTANGWVYDEQITKKRKELASFREALDKLKPPIEVVTVAPEEAKQAEPVAQAGIIVAPDWADKVAQKNGYAVVGQNADGWALFEKDGNRIIQETARKQPKHASVYDQIIVPWSDTLEWSRNFSTADELAISHAKTLEYAQFKVGDKVIHTNFGGKQTVGTVETVKASPSVVTAIGLNAAGGLGLSRGKLQPNISYTLTTDDGKKLDYASQEQVQAYDPALMQEEKKPEPAAEPVKAEVPAGVSIGQFNHTQSGVKQYSVAFKDRVERDVFDRAKQIAGGFGVKYSAFRGRGAIPGFLFMNEEKAKEFAQEIGKLVAGNEKAETTQPTAEQPKPVERQPAEYEAKAATLFAAMDDNARHGVQFGMFPAPLMAQAEQEGYSDTQALTTQLMAEWKKAQQKPAKIEMPNESATLEAKETPNANAEQIEAGRNGQRVPEVRAVADVSPDAGEQGTGRDRGEPGRGRSGDVQRPDGLVDGRRAEDERGRAADAGAGADSVSDDAGEPGGRIGAGANARISARADGGRNYLAPVGALERKGSWLDTAKRNVEIIKLVKRLGNEGRQATAEEQALIAQYVGFGASELANGLFPPEYEYVRVSGRGYQTKKVPTGRVDESVLKPGWKEVYFDLKNSVTEEDMKQIMASTQFAHFTSEKVIRSIWKAVEQFGFAGGKIVEPGMGTGLFMVAAPEQVANASRYVGIERDNVTAAIASQLLQGQSVIRNSYIDQNLPDNNFDMAIGNPPFAGWKVTADPRYKKHGFFLHDYFFAKTIDKVRPGGILVFVTSKGTMDKQDDKARAYLAERADLLGAIRLPQTAFKGNAGTEVVTDVLFLKKRGAGAAPSSVGWTGLKEVETPQGPTKVNEYFADHPDMVLGKHEMVGSMYGPNQYTVTPLAGDIEDHFAKAVERLPENVYTKADPIKRGSVKGEQQKSDRQEFDVAGKKEGGLYIAEDGELMQVVNGVGVPLSNQMALSDKESSWIRDYVPLRDKLKQAMKDQLEDGNWEASLAELKKAYAAFKKKHGRILEHTQYEREFENEAGDVETRTYKRFKWGRLLKSGVDIETTLVQGLESINENNTDVVDGGILVNGRVLAKRADPEIKTVNDAFAVTLNTLGLLDIPRIAELMDVSEDDAIKQLGDLVYEHPVDGWQTADEYLSGNVLKKLEEAEVAAATDPRFQRNVQALIAVQPAPLGPDRIVVRLGANWIPADVVQKFTRDALDEGVAVIYEPRTNRWTVEGENLRRNRAAGAEWGTSDRSMPEILSAVLNNESITIRRTTEDKKTYVDKDATAKANDVAEKMRQRFASWVWTEAERTENLLAIYNRKFNNLAPRAFDGKHLTLPGLSMRYKLYDHQLRAIWRVVQTGNTYLDHAVGAGKTLEMIVSSMEQKRLGLISKPMFVVPNHMLEQFANEFQEAYPAARILVADKENFIGDQRRRFVAKAAMNDWDAIIIKQSSFGLIGIKQETANSVSDDILDELQSALDDADKDDRTTRKKLEAQIEQVKQRVGSMVGKGDGNVTFEELGVDFLYVDEAHTYRKLDYATNRQVKGIDPNGSKGAFGLFAKMRYLESKKPGRSAVMASGTPVTNTIAELYTVQRFLDYDGLREDGLHAFDAWANNFGAVGQEWERNAAGEYEKVERFSKFVNVPELMQRVRKFMDVLTMDQLGQYVQRPNLKGGQPEMITAEKSDALDRYMREELLPRLEESKKWKPSKEQPYNPDPVIAIGTDGRLAAIDARFAYPTMKDDPGSKLNLMINHIIDEYKVTANNVYTTDGKPDKIKGGTQIVFSSVGFGENVEQNRGFSPRKWMLERLKKAGIPSSEVAFMSDYKTDKQKEAMFREMREGKKRILIGSPANMGTGVNVQKRLTSLHFMAPPWYPSDVEQPHGRILRQGNQNKEVSIKWYVTAGTYDSTMWGMVRRKGGAIEQAFRGDGARTVEDISEVSSYAMAEAVAAGDDRVIKLAEAQANVEKYTRLKNAHFTEQRTLRGDVAYLDSEARSLRSAILRFENAVAAQKEAGYSAWGELPVTVGGQTLTKPGEVGERLGDKVADVFRAEAETPLGKVQGQFDLVGTYSPASRNYSKKEEAGIELRIGEVSIRVTDGTMTLDEWTQQDAVGLGQRVKNAMRKVDERLNESRRRLKDVESQLGKKRPLVGAPFSDESQLAQAIADAAQLQAELVGESIKKQQARSETKTEEQGGEQAGAGNVAERQASLSPADKSVYGMVAEGKSAADILKFIASASRNPLNRQLAKLLLKTGIAPLVMAGQSDGWKFNAGNDKKYAAAYNPNTDTISLFRPASAERNFLHEAMHAATLRALGKRGMAAGQMRALFNHVKKSGKLKGMYGMSDVDEFVAEAFTNPKFQEALKTIDAPASVSGLSSAWHWFVRVVRGILGLPSNQESALSQAIEIGLGVMREDMAMRQQQARGDFAQASPAERKDALMRMPATSIDDTSLDGMDKAAIRAEVSRRFNVFKTDPVTALDGREVRFNGVGLREMRAHSADIRTMLLTNKAPELMRKAIPLFSKDHVPSGPNDSIKAWHYYGAKVVLNGKTLFARIVAREAINGSIYYDNDLTTVEDVNGRAGDAILTKTGAAAVSADKHSLVSWLASIKSKKARFNEAPEAADRDGLVRIFSGLEARGLAKDKAEAALAERGDAERIKYIQDNFIDILAELEEAGAVQINCD